MVPRNRSRLEERRERVERSMESDVRPGRIIKKINVGLRTHFGIAIFTAPGGYARDVWS